ncbi:hypothetical protein [Pseudobdellovibrio exovorus]|uniref:Uncharacterized protein n=1 Tax=Pseudobdellovibrio exovorus JSS TaxID=1184267 RepID=M4V9V6_9BACT|nr:hypothetical protein [Pseudobdellovibrio exovorus]AGH95973.1 hypothetical protein A11Q_1757 [Pseudobdellovibrio exovorus JSS]
MSDIIHKRNYKDRYRTIFCDRDFYIKHQALFRLWKTRFHGFSDVEKATAWTLALCCLRRPEDWFGGRRPRSISPHMSEPLHPLSLENLFAGSPIRIPNKVSGDMNVLDALNTLLVKAVPESCFRSLIYTHTGRYPLWVTQEVPTPEELLHLQIAGRRVLSYNEDFTSWPDTLYADRDFLGFVLHDLIHADHFFHDPLHRDGQLGFYRFIESILHNKSLTRLLESENFRKGFEYIISDMNSHPVHLFQTLHSLVFSEIQDDATSSTIWSAWSSKPEFLPTEVLALSRINGRDFSVSDAQQLEILCIRLGQSSSQ